MIVEDQEAKVKWLEKKIETEQDEYKLEKYKIDLDEEDMV